MNILWFTWPSRYGAIETLSSRYVTVINPARFTWPSRAGAIETFAHRFLMVVDEHSMVHLAESRWRD